MKNIVSFSLDRRNARAFRSLHDVVFCFIAALLLAFGTSTTEAQSVVQFGDQWGFHPYYTDIAFIGLTVEYTPDGDKFYGLRSTAKMGWGKRFQRTLSFPLQLGEGTNLSFTLGLKSDSILFSRRGSTWVPDNMEQALTALTADHCSIGGANLSFIGAEEGPTPSVILKFETADKKHTRVSVRFPEWYALAHEGMAKTAVCEIAGKSGVIPRDLENSNSLGRVQSKVEIDAARAAIINDFENWRVHSKDEIRAIVAAVIKGDLEKVKTLLKGSPDLVSSKDFTGRPLLHIAAYRGYKDVAELLLANKAEVNAKEDWFDRTPLHEAALKGHKDMVELLLTNKAEVNAKSKDGSTPLHLAASEGHKDVVELLRQHGGHE